MGRRRRRDERALVFTRTKHGADRVARQLNRAGIAARAIDIESISHVLNYDLPSESETYVHRIGRTGPAGATGVAVSLCDNEEREYLKAIERLTGRAVPAERGLSAGARRVDAARPQKPARVAPRCPSKGRRFC